MYQNTNYIIFSNKMNKSLRFSLIIIVLLIFSPLPKVHANTLNGDGKIAFDRQLVSGGSARDIYVMSSDGSDQILLYQSTNDNPLPVWSPDGTKIAFLLKSR